MEGLPGERGPVVDSVHARVVPLPAEEADDSSADRNGAVGVSPLRDEENVRHKALTRFKGGREEVWSLGRRP